MAAAAGQLYSSVYEFAAELNLVWKNCLAYNEQGSRICKQAKILSDLCDNLLSKHVIGPRKGVVNKEREERDCVHVCSCGSTFL